VRSESNRTYPNCEKLTDRVTFSFNDEPNAGGEVLIYKVTGEIVLRFSPSVGQSNGLSQLSSGIYFYEYRIDKQPIQKGKLVKQ